MQLHRYLIGIAVTGILTLSGPLRAGSEVVRVVFPPQVVATPEMTDTVAQGLRVTVDFGVILHVEGGISVIAVGNPAIADANLVNHQTLLVTGQMAGTTNIIALDDTGRVLVDVKVHVSAWKPGMVSERRGTQIEVHDCISGLCEAASTKAAPTTVAPLTTGAGS